MILKQLGCFFIGLAVVGIIALLVIFAAPMRGVINEWRFGIQKVDDSTRYSTRKEVEDTARAMISSYHADKQMFDQYTISENAEERSWASQARNRANRTAATYNEYILKNSFVWSGNVPEDIRQNLATISNKD